MDLQGWIDVLEPLDEGTIRRAWAAYQIGGPRTSGGRLMKPDAGAIYRIAKALPMPPVSRDDDARFVGRALRQVVRLATDVPEYGQRITRRDGTVVEYAGAIDGWMEVME